MGNVTKTHKIEIALFLLAFIARLIVSVFLVFPYGEAGIIADSNDAVGYLELARNLSAGNGFILGGEVSTLRTPIYPLFLAAFEFLHLPAWSVAVAQNILFSFSVVFVFWIGTLLFSRRTGIFGAALFALEPFGILTTNVAISEALFMFLFLLSVLFFVKFYFKKQYVKFIAVSGFFMGLSALTRPVVLYLPIFMFFFSFLYAWRRREWRKQLQAVAVFIALFIITVLPWSVRNFVHFRTFRIANMDAIMLYRERVPIVLSARTGIDYNAAVTQNFLALYEKFPDFSIHNFKYYDYLESEAIRILKSDLPTVIKFHILAAGNHFFTTGYNYVLEDIGIKRYGEITNFTKQIIFLGSSLKELTSKLSVHDYARLGGAALWLLIYILIIAGLVKYVRRGGSKMVLLAVFVFIVYIALVSIGPHSQARYRIPSYPFWFMLLAVAIETLFARSKQQAASS